VSKDTVYDYLVLGGGVSGLTLAHELATSGKDLRIGLVEAQSQVGGCAQSVHQEGYLFEKGPFNLLVRDPLFEDLLVRLGNRVEVVSPSAKAKRRDLLLGGRLRKLPGSLVEAITTPILTFPQKIRVLLEPLLGKRPADPDPTLGELFRRRFGNGFVDRVLSAAVVGIFGGDADRLSARSCFSFFWEIDRSSSSFLVGGIKRRLTSRMNTRKWKGMVSFEGGLGAFCSALGEPLGEDLRVATRVESIHRAEQGFEVGTVTPDGTHRTLEAKNIVLGFDHPTAVRFLEGLALEVAEELAPIESVSLAVVNLGIAESSFQEIPEGFGFLVPKTETDVRILGTLWASSVFPHQAPPGGVAVRIFVGGVRSPEWVGLPDAELFERAFGELKRFVAINGDPETVYISRYENAVPQMVPGHTDRIDRVERLLENHPNLFLVGNYLRGVSVNDCVCHARKTALKILKNHRSED
jgi:oxygen-dependent protoporphyrinogen oxidase